MKKIESYIVLSIKKIVKGKYLLRFVLFLSMYVRVHEGIGIKWCSVKLNRTYPTISGHECSIITLYVKISLRHNENHHNINFGCDIYDLSLPTDNKR